jgi:hypothetical protein
VTEPAYLAEIRTAYDTVAVDYAEKTQAWLATSPLDRAMLSAFCGSPAPARSASRPAS